MLNHVYHKYPPQGYYKSCETTELFRAGMCDVKWIIAKKVCHGKPLLMIKWQGYCSSQNTWEPKTHLPPELIKAFKNPDPDPVRMEETRERIGLVLKEG